jgi:hypothetical protein
VERFYEGAESLFVRARSPWAGAGKTGNAQIAIEGHCDRRILLRYKKSSSKRA